MQHNNSSSFYVFLPSNTKVEGNRTNSFRVRLPQKLEFGSDWSVGLAVLVYPHTWLSLGTSQQQYIKIRYASGDELRMEIPSGSMRNPRDLVNGLNDLLKHNGRPELADRVQLLIRISTETKKRAEQMVRDQDLARRNRVLEHRQLEHRINIEFRDDADEASDDSAADIIDDEPVPTMPEELIQHMTRSNYLSLLPDFMPEQTDREWFTKLCGGGGSHYLAPNVPLEKWTAVFREPRSVCKFMFHDERQRFAVSMDSTVIVGIELSEQLAYIMGFSSTSVEKTGDARFVPDMTGGVSSFNIYVPGLIEPVIIGDITAPLLRMVNIRGQPDECIEETYVAIQYHRLLVKEVSEIFVEIRSSSGALMPFQYGTCTLTLHFRKIPYF
jgi:hypothetical protein